METQNISLPDMNILKQKYPGKIEIIMKKIQQGYPVQYLIGNVEFLNTTIKVNKNALIPRFETELLVEKTIKYAKRLFNNKTIDIIDLGTGTGCIAIALKKNLSANITAVDISKKCLDLARENAKLNKTEIKFMNLDMTAKLNHNYDIIISNPPYIKEGGFVDVSVKKYEPALALYAPDEGIYFYKKILENHLNNLNKPGLIAFEIGDNEAHLLEEYLNNYPNLKYEFSNDLAGMPRYLFIFNE